MQGKGYDGASGEGRRVLERLAAVSTPVSLAASPSPVVSEPPIAAARFQG